MHLLWCLFLSHLNFLSEFSKLHCKQQISFRKIHFPNILKTKGLSVCLSVCLSVYLSVCLSVYLSICLSVYLSICLSVYLSICLSVHLSICTSICLSVYLSICLWIQLRRKSIEGKAWRSKFLIIIRSL